MFCLSPLRTSGADVLVFTVGLFATCFTSDWPLLSKLLTSGVGEWELFLSVCRLIARELILRSEFVGVTVLPLGCAARMETSLPCLSVPATFLSVLRSEATAGLENPDG